MDKNESLTPQEKEGGDRSKLPVFSLATAVLFVADLYIMINLPKNYPALVIITVLFLASVYAAVNMVLQEIAKSKMQEQEQHDALLKSGKANYIQTKKVMDQIADIGNQTAIPGEDIITAQKAIAKVTITRNKENTDALMNSNDQVLEKLYAFEEKIGESQSELLNRQRSIMDDIVREFSENQQEITARVAGLETSLKEELLQVTSFLHEIEEKVSQPVYIQPQAVPTAAEEPESVIETGLDAQIPIADKTDLGGEIDLGVDISLSGDIDFGEEINPDADINFGEEIDLGREIGLEEDINLDSEIGLGEETVLSGDIDLGEEISLDTDLGLGEEISLGTDINFGEEIDLGGEISLGEEVSLDGDIGIGEEISLDGDIDLEEDISLSGDIDFGEETSLSGDIDFGEETNLSGDIDLGEETNLSGDIDFGEETNLSGDIDLGEETNLSGEVVPGEEIDLESETDEGGEILFGGGSLSGEKAHTEAEMFLGEEIVSESGLEAEQDISPAEEVKEVIEPVMTAPVQEPEPQPQPVKPEPQPVKQEAPDLSNPNKMLTPDEIAALIANM